MKQNYWKLLLWAGLASLGQSSEHEFTIDFQPRETIEKIIVKRPIVHGLSAPTLIQPIQLLNVPLNTADITPIHPLTFTDNPFRNTDESYIKGNNTINIDAWVSLYETGRLGEEKYFDESIAMNKHDSLREVLKTKKLPRSERKALEEKILADATYYGRVATNWRFRKSYDRNLTKKRIKEYELDWTDCTKSVFEDYATASGDNKIIDNYLAHAGEKKYLTIFPRVTSKYLHDNGFELIYVAIDTKAMKWANRYHIGGGKYSHARPFYRQVKRGNYYAPIDYVVKDERVFTPAFKKFIEEVPAILFLEEFLHVGTNHEGFMVDSKWGSSPLEENNFERRNLYDLLTVEQEDTKENIRSMVMVVPEGAVETFINNYVKK